MGERQPEEEGEGEARPISDFLLCCLSRPFRRPRTCAALRPATLHTTAFWPFSSFAGELLPLSEWNRFPSLKARDGWKEMGLDLRCT